MARAGLGPDGYVEAGWPANRQPAAAVCRAGGSVQPQPHGAPGARHRAGPGWRGARPLPGAVGHWTPSVASRGAEGPVEGEWRGVPAPLSLQHGAAGCLPKVRVRRAGSGGLTREAEPPP